jgi:hypothetical protein
VLVVAGLDLNHADIAGSPAADTDAPVLTTHAPADADAPVLTTHAPLRHYVEQVVGGRG